MLVHTFASGKFDYVAKNFGFMNFREGAFEDGVSGTQQVGKEI